MTRRFHATLTICLALAGMLLGGCAAGFTRPNYDTVYEGMPAESVRDRLGTPDSVDGNTWRYEHTGPPGYKAEIVFKNGRVWDKNWREIYPPGSS